MSDKDKLADEIDKLTDGVYALKQDVEDLKDGLVDTEDDKYVLEKQLEGLEEEIANGYLDAVEQFTYYQLLEAQEEMDEWNVKIGVYLDLHSHFDGTKSIFYLSGKAQEKGKKRFESHKAP